MNNFLRFEALVGQEKFVKFKEKHILICGLGGVGGYVLEALVRSGIGSITIVDFDVFDPTNLNRQILSLESNIGKLKSEVGLEHAKAIHSNLNIRQFSCKIAEDTLHMVFDLKYDHVIDCIDDVPAKILLWKQCQKKNIPIIASMGAALKRDPSKIKIAKLKQTHTDPLAKKLRYLVKDEPTLLEIPVVFSTEVVESLPKYAFLPSGAIVPAISGLFLASYVIEYLLGLS